MSIPFPDIDPVALWLGPLPIRWYALSYLAGFLLGWRYCLYLAKLSPRLRPDPVDIDDFLPWAMGGVILGGRLGYILFYNFSSYLHNPLEILQLWHGGMSFHGGALGVIVALIVFSLRRKMNPLAMADIVCAAVPIGLFFGRIANFINGELFGRPTLASWGMVFPQGGLLPRHPSQIYEAVLEGLLLFLILLAIAKTKSLRERHGLISGVFLIGYALFRSIAELFREPDAHIGFIWGAVSMGQILSAPMIIGGAVCIFLALRRPKTA